MTVDGDLVARLRRAASNYSYSDSFLCGLLSEAADTLGVAHAPPFVVRDSGDAAHIDNLETERDDLLRRLHLLINAVYDAIEKAEDENWLHYNGTDDSRLQGLEDALEAVGTPDPTTR